MKLIIIPLFFIIILALSVQMVNFASIDSYSTATGTQYNPNYNGTTGSQQEQLGINNMTFNLTVMGGFLALFIAVAGIGIASGLNISVLGSTVKIDERSQKILYNSLFYGGLWGIFSVLATTGINGFGLFSLPTFGVPFYLILTLIYVLGINNQIEGK